MREQRADRRSTSLEASGPYRMISGVRATGARFEQAGRSSPTKHECGASAAASEDRRDGDMATPARLAVAGQS